MTLLRQCLVPAVGALMLLSATALPAATRVEVIGDHVNLRALAGGTAEVVAQVNSGDVLNVPGDIGDEWVEVSAPEHAAVWIYAELVKDRIVTATKVRVRGGAGINYRPVGHVEKGEKVKVLGKEGDWLKIAPPSGTTLWISRTYIKPVVDKPPRSEPATATGVASEPPPPVSAPAPVPVPPPAPAPVASPPGHVALPGAAGRVTPPPAVAPKRPELPSVAPPREIRIPVALAGRTLIASKEQGKNVRYAGTVSYSTFVWHRPSRYSLIDERTGRGVTTCYLLGNEPQLKTILGHPVEIHGREYWVQGVKLPVVVPERIVRR